MMNARKDFIEHELDQIITNITGFSLTDSIDSENVALCRRYALSNVFYHRYMDTNSHEVQRHLVEICEKLNIHALFDASEKLRSLWRRFVDDFDWSTHNQYDVQWRLLSFLLHASGRPSTLHEYGLLDPGPHHQSPASPIPDSGQEDDTQKSGLFVKFGYSASVDSDHSLSDWSDLSEDEQCRVQESHQLLANSNNKSKRMDGSGVAVCTDVHYQPVDIERARQWLYQNVVSPYSEYQPYQCHVPELPEQLAVYRGRLGLTAVSGSPAPLAERRVCRELLWQLMAPAATRLLNSGSVSDSFVGPVKSDHSNGGFQLAPNFRIYGVTQRASAKMLARFCLAIGHVQHLRGCQRVFSPGSDGEVNGSNPAAVNNLLTYRAFYESVSTQLQQLDELLVRLHKQLLSAAGVFTILTLYNRLRRWFSLLKFLHTIQCRGIDSIPVTSPAWLKSMRLVSVLFSVAVQCDNISVWSSVVRDIFVSTTRPLLRIISHWMSFEVFTDLTNEFFLSRNADVSVDDPGFWSSGFLVHYSGCDDRDSAGTAGTRQPAVPWTDHVDPLPFLLPSIRHIIETAKCIRILDRLHHSQVFDGESLFGSLHAALCESASVSTSADVESDAIYSANTATNEEPRYDIAQALIHQSVVGCLPEDNSGNSSGDELDDDQSKRAGVCDTDSYLPDSGETLLGVVAIEQSGEMESADSGSQPCTALCISHADSADLPAAAKNADSPVSSSCVNARHADRTEPANKAGNADLITADSDSVSRAITNQPPVNECTSHQRMDSQQQPTTNRTCDVVDGSPFSVVLSAENDQQLSVAFSQLATTVADMCSGDSSSRMRRKRSESVCPPAHIPFINREDHSPSGLLSTPPDSIPIESPLDTCAPLTPPLSVVLKHRLSATIMTHCSTVCRRLVDVLFEEYRLAEHVNLLCRVCLCSIDALVSQFIHTVLEESPHLVYPVSGSSHPSTPSAAAVSVRWTLCLQSCAASLHADFGSLFSVAAPGSHGSSSSTLGLHYAAPWPVSLLLDRRCVQLYSEVFVFVASLKHCLHQLESLRFADLCVRVDMSTIDGGVVSINGGVASIDGGVANSSSVLIHRMHLLRSWLLNFVATIHSHIVFGIMQCPSEPLIRDLRQSCSVGKLMNIHERYLSRLRRFCLLEGVHERRVQSKIVQALELCRRLVAMWQTNATTNSKTATTPILALSSIEARGVALPTDDAEGGDVPRLGSAKPSLQLVSQLEAQYAHVHYFLSLYLQQFRTQITHLEPLAVALVHSSPFQVPQEELAKLDPR